MRNSAVSLYRRLFKSFTDFLNNISRIQPECQTVLIQIRPDVLSGMVWVQTICKGYQQATLVGKELKGCLNSLKIRNTSIIIRNPGRDIFFLLYTRKEIITRNQNCKQSRLRAKKGPAPPPPPPPREFCRHILS